MTEPHPTYTEMILWPMEQIRTHVEACPGTRDGQCIPGLNALRSVRQEIKTRASLTRIGRKGARTDGLVKKGRIPLRGNRCPTKRELL